MTNSAQDAPVRGRIDLLGRLVEADPALARLHAHAGGEEGGRLAIPQIASIVRLARRLGIVISRSAVAAEGDIDLDLWVRAQPMGSDVELAITGWQERAPRSPVSPSDAEREIDFLRASADWMWETDETLRLKAVSPAAAHAIDKSPGDLILKPLTCLFHLQEGSDGAFPILTALAEQRRFEGQLAELRGGSKGRYRLSGIPLIDGAGRFAGFRGGATQLSEPEAQASVATRPEDLPDPVDVGAFGERLDKALRGPLDHIITNAETISNQPEGPLRHDYAGYARDIAAAGRHLLELVDDLVDLQAIERANFQPESEDVDLADLARRAAGLLAVRASDRTVKIDRPNGEDALPATGEFKRVLQILMNLLSNAIRYSPEGGTVSIHGEHCGERACIIVSDQGPGIANADQERIFHKFERVDPVEPGGTGLGLYIARRLARAMGGDITVESAPGEGACFTLDLPSR